MSHHQRRFDKMRKNFVKTYFLSRQESVQQFKIGNSMDLFALVYAIHAYSYLLSNQKSLISKCLQLLFITIFSCFIFKCTQFGRKWLSPFVTNYPHFFSKKKDFRQKEQFFQISLPTQIMAKSYRLCLRYVFHVLSVR